MFRQGKKDVQKSLFDQDQAFPNHIIEILKKSWAEDFYRLIFTQINEKRFSILYSDKASRPNKPVNILVSLLILKQQNLLSDEELLGSLYFDYRFQYALGLESDSDRERLCINTLSNFRCSLVEHEIQTGESLLQQEMESLAEKMAEFLSINKSMARMDSTMLDSSCKKMNRIELVYTVIRNMVRELNKILEIVIPESFLTYLEKGHKNKVIYKTKSTEEESKLDFLIQQAYDLHQWVQNESMALDTDAFAHLSRLLHEQSVESDEGIAVPIEGSNLSSRILQNPSDPDATFRHKSGKDHIGSILNLVEVHDTEKEVGLIMHADLKENTHSDAQFGEDFVKNHPLAKEIKTLAVDGAYFRQETVKHADENNLEINFSQMTGRSVSDDYVGVDQFKIDLETHKIIKCPQGFEPTFSIYDPEKEVYTAKFYKEHCQECPLLEHCQVKEQKRAYHVSFSENKRRTDQTRAKIGTERHRKLSNYRAGVEGVPSVLKRAYQLEHLPVRGQVCAKIWIYASIIAQNFKRCTRYLKNIAPVTV
jgi:hypothetical protein